ncbi:MAG: bifunctional proline dehydrogenase/L-glutamate gamma-semialdehyde dehydrogenase PutA, partial [Paracoccaceae bacterium]
MTLPALLRQNIRDMSLSPEALILKDLQADYGPTATQRQRIARAGADLVSRIRHETKPGVMDLFLADYGLSSEEGIALMCLAEALLRVPDTATMDDLIEDKIASSDWAIHLGKSSSSLINASTWALMLTGKVLQNPQEHRLTDILRTTIKRMGEPVIRRAATQAMKIMGHQFVLGETIQDAVRRAKPQEDQGYTYSYDMLAEAALTQSDADIFFESYTTAISYLAPYAIHTDQRENPGISIKLSALHPRYEQGQAKRVIAELVPRVLRLAQAAARANMGLNIDAEEADRLDLSLDVIEAVLRDPSLKGWDGLGVVVQAYGKRAGPVIDWLHAMACDLDRKIMVRLVKGAYWDTEIKHAQVLGLPDYPVFTTKPATDVSYLCCAQKLLRLSDRLYPQFATHNAHTIAAILDMAAPEQQPEQQPEQRYEFQRLHGMGEAVHALVKTDQKTRCRIYAPVGAHRDLLAYLVRRLLENGANSSFVNQLVDTTVPPETLAADPFEHLSETALPKPPMLYHPDRENSAGWNLQTPDGMAHFKKARAPFATTKWAVGPILHGWQGAQSTPHNTVVGSSRLATKAQADHALAVAKPWGLDVAKRADILRRAANLYEETAGEFFALLAREAGKTAQDAVDELREAVDFLRFYANEGLRLGDTPARGIITCISPWNFPLAIFTGQIAAALAAGNGVLAKPADPTPAIAHLATRLLHRAGIPVDALQLLPGDGPGIGTMLTSNSRVNGVCFTGSTAVAQTINRTIAERLAPDACLIAETGGINAMIVDSTALPEQAVKDIVDGAFRSAGQRCS